MKKKLALILAGTAMAAMVLAGCGEKNNASGEDAKTAESVEDKKTFTVGFDAEYPPYGYMDENGEYTGFDLELAEAVCKLEGWELVKKPLNWDSKDMELNSGSIDCIWNGFTMNGREDDYTFSTPYVDNSQVIVVAEKSGIDTWKIWRERQSVYRLQARHWICCRVKKKAVRKNWQIHLEL